MISVFFRIIFRSFILLFALSSVVLGDDYHWKVSRGGSDYVGSSPREVCDKYISNIAVPAGSTAVFKDILFMSEINARCTVDRVDAAGKVFAGAYNLININRYGDACPFGKKYDERTGSCGNDCSSTLGEQLAARGPNVPAFLDGEGKRFLAGSDFSGACFDGCYYEKASSRTLGCFLVSGSTDTGFCNYRVEGNGTSCPASTGEPAGGGDPLNPADPPPTDPEEPDEPDPGCPPPFIFNGTFCQSKPGDGGGDGGGSGGGGGSSGGGSGGGGGGDGGGGDGGGSGSDGDGSGDGGKGDGSGSSGGGSGEGEGLEENGNKGTASSSCETPPSSEGDPLVGAILKQQWISMCHGEELKPAQVESALTQSGMKSADELTNHLSDNAENIDSKVTSIINGVFTSGPSSSCPVKDFTFSYGGRTIAIPFSVNCPIFTVISAVMFWFSYLAAGWILFNSLVRD